MLEKFIQSKMGLQYKHEHILSTLKVEYRLSRWGVAGAGEVASQTTLLHMKSINKTEVPMIFNLLCILGFQRQPFRF